MPSLLQQLENNEAILLMYLADELPAEDRAEVESMLSRDPALRRDLAALQQAQAAMDQSLTRLDERSELPIAESASVRRVARSIEQWKLDRLRRQPEVQPSTGGLRYPWWTYPSAAAAAVLVAFLVWWGNTDQLGPPMSGPEIPLVYGPSTVDDSESALLLASFDGWGNRNIEQAESELLLAMDSSLESGLSEAFDDWRQPN